MATQAVHSALPVLNSWKEIASYLGRGVRTVQRYEREQRLPVRRVQGKSRSSVMALKSDLDLWLSSTHVGSSAAREINSDPIISELRKSLSDHAILRDKFHALHLSHQRSLVQLQTSLERMTEQIRLMKEIRLTNARCFDPCSATITFEEQSLQSGVFLRKNS